MGVADWTVFDCTLNQVVAGKGRVPSAGACVAPYRGHEQRLQQELLPQTRVRRCPPGMRPTPNMGVGGDSIDHVVKPRIQGNRGK